MSRVIRNDHPWSDDEKEFVLARSGGTELVAQNEQEYPPGSEPDASPDDEELELSQEIYEHVKNLSVEETQQELRQHKLPTKGDESDLKVRLAQYLQEQKNKGA